MFKQSYEMALFTDRKVLYRVSSALYIVHVTPKNGCIKKEI